MGASFPQPPEPAKGARGRGLGRGLGALIPGAQQGQETGVTEIPVDRIKPNSFQPRSEFNPEELSDLEMSIREQGVLQPVLVRPSGDGYEIVAGERRLRAAVAAGLRTVPAIIRQLDDRGTLEAALVENLQREDLSPIDRARAYRRMTEEFGLSQEALARRVGRSQPSIANTLRLLSLPDEVQRALESGRITEGHARALLTVGDRDRTILLWKAIEGKGLSVRQVEAAARRRRSISREISLARLKHEGEVNIIERLVSERLGAPVRLAAGKSGRGEIRISFFSPVDLERLLEAMGITPREGR